MFAIDLIRPNKRFARSRSDRSFLVAKVRLRIYKSDGKIDSNALNSKNEDAALSYFSSYENCITKYKVKNNYRITLIIIFVFVAFGADGYGRVQNWKNIFSIEAKSRKYQYEAETVHYGARLHMLIAPIRTAVVSRAFVFSTCAFASL